MAAWTPKIVQATRNQNACVNSFALQIHNYCTKSRVIKNPSVTNLKRGTGGRSSFNGVVCTVFGANGFIGKNLCNRLGRVGTQLILPHRCDLYHIRDLKIAGDLGQVLFHPFDLRDDESIIRSIKYSNVVINLIGANYETLNFSYKDVHIDGARKLARLAKQCNVQQFIHVSCLNASEKPEPIITKGGSKILKSKWAGELAVKEEFPEATIIRPSVVYGRSDKFVAHYLNPFRPSSKGRVISLWGRGEKTEKQPVYIGDVVSGIVATIKNLDAAGKTYQFVGPQRYKLKELVEWIYSLGWKNVYDTPVHVTEMKYSPLALMKTTFLTYLRMIHPFSDMTWDVLEHHHVSDKVNAALPTLEDLGVMPAKMDDHIYYAIQPMERAAFAIKRAQRPYTVHG